MQRISPSRSWLSEVGEGEASARKAHLSGFESRRCLHSYSRFSREVRRVCQFHHSRLLPQSLVKRMAVRTKLFSVILDW